MPDFSDIARELNTHFCEQCKASFECDDEDGYCDCPFSDHFSRVLCDACTEAELAELERERERERDEDGNS